MEYFLSWGRRQSSIIKTCSSKSPRDEIECLRFWCFVNCYERFKHFILFEGYQVHQENLDFSINRNQNGTVKSKCVAKKCTTAQKMKFSIKDFFSKCDQIRREYFVQSTLDITFSFSYCRHDSSEIVKKFRNFHLSDYKSFTKTCK